MGVKLA